MSDLVLTLTPTQYERSKEDILKLLDAEIERFSQFMTTLPGPAQGALSNPERALLKTYFVHKLQGRID